MNGLFRLESDPEFLRAVEEAAYRGTMRALLNREVLLDKKEAMSMLKVGYKKLHTLITEGSIVEKNKKIIESSIKKYLESDSSKVQNHTEKYKITQKSTES